MFTRISGLFRVILINDNMKSGRDIELCAPECKLIPKYLRSGGDLTLGGQIVPHPLLRGSHSFL